MKRLLFTAALLLTIAGTAAAQTFIINESIFQQRLSEISTTVLDSLTSEPVGFASVYVIPAKDTTITNFTLTDAKGEAKLDEVPFGDYIFHVEMMGYRPYVKQIYFRDSKVNIGTIKLSLDEQFLQAATVSDIGNPIIVKQDTVEFNASSFRVGSNAMLKDLLQRMPGMSISEDGKVKFNGEEIDKLTVGGRTFFFNDQSMALNNLPASVVDKIRVIDRESEQTRASGIQDGSREKVLDVGLKKEYEKGWFGNVGLKGGTTASPKGADDPMRDSRGLLWGGNTLISAYTEKDQLTVIANAQNVDDSGATIVIVSGDGDTINSGQGLSTGAQLGVNANTTRIKNVETAVSANYKYTDTDSGNSSERTTFQDSGDLTSTSENIGKTFANSLSANVEMAKENGKVWFHVRPSFRIDKQDSFRNSSSQTSRKEQEGGFLNSSDNSSSDFTTNKLATINSDVTFRGLFGKEDRTLNLNLNATYRTDEGESSETTVLNTATSSSATDMNYTSGGSGKLISGQLRYTEPLGEKLTLATSAQYSWQKQDNTRDAFDAAGRNDYYSSVSNTRSIGQEYALTAQYKFSERSWMTLGGSLSGILNETFSKSFGIEDTAGKDEWNWFLTPTLRIQHSVGSNRLSFYMSGYSQRPANSRMLPVLNISDPSRLSLGNVYLKPYSYTFFNASWNRSNRERFSSFFAYLYGQVNSGKVSSALWYDTDGVLYTIPVNTRKPSVSASLSLSYTTPLGAEKLWSLTLGASAGYSSGVSYQTLSTRPALDKESFDYSEFMADFWGNADGDRFYGGDSGFLESRTDIITPGANFNIKYNPEHWSVRAGVSTEGRIARYSLDSKANMNTLDTRFNAAGSYTTKNEFEFSTDLSYVLYNGYAAGYGQPEWQWNFEVSKNIGAFNLSIKINDILDQTRNLTHTVTANYTEDSYRLVMGRHLLFGVKWNFGKMNAAHSENAQMAAMRMVL